MRTGAEGADPAGAGKAGTACAAQRGENRFSPGGQADLLRLPGRVFEEQAGDVMKGVGVDWYLVAECPMKFYFQEGRVCCMNCHKKGSRTTGGIQNTICLLTYESLNQIDIFNEVGSLCPLEFTGEMKGEIKCRLSHPQKAEENLNR